MNDPHVAVLIYKIEHGDSIDYSKAKPLDHEEAGFRVKITNGQVCFKFKDHYASVDEAREAIGDYIRSWEFDAGLREGPNRFKLKFDQSQIEDRNPTPGAVSIGTPIRFSFTVSEPTVTLSPACYPPPPSGLKLTPDVQTLYDRYKGYCQDRELLAGMAYFCLTVLENSVAQQPQKASTNRKTSTKRKKAAEKYGIELEVLTKIGHLSSEKGGQQARKASGTNNNLTAQDRRFLEEAIKAIIRRAAEKAYPPHSDFPEISLSAFPPV